MIGARIGVAACGALALAGLANPAWAQTPRVAVAVGGTFAASAGAGMTEAILLDPSGGPLVLYRTTNRISSGAGIEAMVSMRLRERVRAELGVGWAATGFESRISGDFEGVESLTVTQKCDQYTADVALTWRVMRRGRADLFLRGGGGVFREITADRAMVDNGWRAGAGAGIQFRLRQGSAWLSRLAIRADVRVQARRGGMAFGNTGTRVSPGLFAGLVFGQ